MAVVVTGARGYLGRLATEALRARDVDVVAVDVRPPEDPNGPGVDHRTLDIRSPQLAATIAEPGVESVVHLAAILEPRPGQDPAEVEEIEVGGTEAVVRGCVEAGVEHLVYASSGAAYGYHPENVGRLLDEDAPLRGHPAFAYSRHKRMAEEVLARARAEHPRLRQLVLRPGTVLGTGTRNQITALFDSRVVIGVAGSEAPFVLAWDTEVAELIATGVVERRSGTYNVAGEGAVTLREIASRAGGRYVALPAALLRTALRVGRPLGLVRYGPEQVDFVRYRPVLDSRRVRADFPGHMTTASSAVLDRYLASR